MSASPRQSTHRYGPQDLAFLRGPEAPGPKLVFPTGNFPKILLQNSLPYLLPPRGMAALSRPLRDALRALLLGQSLGKVGPAAFARASAPAVQELLGGPERASVAFLLPPDQVIVQGVVGEFGDPGPEFARLLTVYIRGRRIEAVETAEYEMPRGAAQARLRPSTLQRLGPVLLDRPPLYLTQLALLARALRAQELPGREQSRPVRSFRENEPVPTEHLVSRLPWNVQLLTLARNPELEEILLGAAWQFPSETAGAIGWGAGLKLTVGSSL